MATFKGDPSEWQRLDWQLLQNSSINLYYSPAILAADLAWFTDNGYVVRSLEGAEWHSDEEFLVGLGALLRFPAVFGHNLNALNDCLSDVEVSLEGGMVLALRDFHRFATPFRRQAQDVLDILAGNSRRLLLRGRRFITLVHSSDPRIQFEPVGATPVTWNPKEWLNPERGL